MEKKFMVVVHPDNFGGCVKVKSRQEIINQAKLDMDYDDSCTFKRCCEMVFGRKYTLIAPAEYKTADQFADRVLGLAKDNDIVLEPHYYSRENLQLFWNIYHK